MSATTTRLERSVQIAMAAMASLGTLLLGLGQQSLVLPAMAILAAVASIVLTDLIGAVRLNRTLANVAALLAVTYALSDFVDRRSSETQLLAVANLLVYLQIVQQFQQKSLRVYWSLSVLSLLQVVVASALNLSVTFGPLLSIYLLVALTALSLLFVLRETERFQPEESGQPPPPPFPPRRWPLAGIEVSLSGAGGEDLVRPLVGGRLVRSVAAMALVTLLATTVVFYGVPRYQRQAWQSPTGRGTSIVGFSEQVSLGQMGRILQSDQPVMRVSFSDWRTQNPFRVSADPYLRGATLTQYQRQSSRSQWKYHGTRRYESDRLEALSIPQSDQGRVIQHVTIESPVQSSMSGRYSILFTTWPVYQHEQSDAMLVENTNNRQLLVDNATVPERLNQFSYTVRSGAFHGTQQSRLAAEAELNEYRAADLGALDPELALHLPALLATAEQVVADAAADSPLAKALALEAHFRTPGNYQYDLDPHVVQNRDLDPIEDFVANHRTGHCEYFASALVLMLRSQGIPARMVVGFKGGEYNAVGSYYLFRQKHAHAWVEAYLGPGEHPSEQVPERSHFPSGHGAWLRLDPTPADDALDADLGTVGLLAHVGDLVAYAQLLWNDYVLGLNPERQRAGIYAPIAEAMSRFWHSLAGGRRMGPWWLAAAAVFWLLWAIPGALLAAEWLRRRRAAQGAEPVPLARLLLAPLVWLRMEFDWLGPWLPRDAPARGAPPAMPVAFYERLEAALRRCGLARFPSQTQRQFAAAAGGLLADEPRLQSVAGVPRKVVEAYYRVRFGGHALDNLEQQTVEQALHELEAALRDGATNDK